MPSKLKTRCRYPGCPQATRNGYCAQHTGQSHRTSDRRRGSRHVRGYDAQWYRVAEVRRKQDCYVCQPCLRRENRVTPARTVDHILPLHVREDWRLELDNLQVICHRCHQQKTIADTRRYGSSTETRLTEAQIENRRTAQQLTEPPRRHETPHALLSG